VAVIIITPVHQAVPVKLILQAAAVHPAAVQVLLEAVPL
jgi:hypothetical protein